jgi:hypothetical protein
VIKFYARCEVCRADIFDAGEVIPYQVCFPGRNLRRVELGNERSPWAGVHCICLNCVQAVIHLALPGLTVDLSRVPQDAPGTTPVDSPV